MKLGLLWCLCIILFWTVSSEKISLKNSKTGRIVGGEQAEAGRFPYAAAIYVTTSTSKFFCGGAILGNQWVITAAQCVDQAISFTIEFGSNTLNSEDANRVTVATSTYVIHPDYNPATLDNDIGLIELRMPIEFTDYIGPVTSLPWTDFDPGAWYLTYGWGQTTDDDPELAEHLNWVSLASISNDECKITYGNQITDNMMCAAGNYNEGTCIGDTGSPLLFMVRYGAAVYGIASFISGNGCESTDPSGYSKIYPHMDWIRNITGLFPI